jgi:signal transduction histidine kinase
VPGIRGRRSGTGLGLAFCKLVVEAHRGSLSVESQPGQGATFAFSLPVAVPPDGA